MLIGARVGKEEGGRVCMVAFILKHDTFKLRKNKRTKLRSEEKNFQKYKKFPLNSTSEFLFVTIGIKPFNITFFNMVAMKSSIALK